MRAISRRFFGALYPSESSQNASSSSESPSAESEQSFKVIYKNKDLDTILGPEQALGDQVHFKFSEFTKSLYLNKISVPLGKNSLEFVSGKVLDLIKKVIKKSLFTRQKVKNAYARIMNEAEDTDP